MTFCLMLTTTSWGIMLLIFFPLILCVVATYQRYTSAWDFLCCWLFRNSINSGYSGMGPSAGVRTSTLAFAAVVLTSVLTLLTLPLVIVQEKLLCLLSFNMYKIPHFCVFPFYLVTKCNISRNDPLILSINVSILGVQCRLFILVEIALTAILIGIFICKCMGKKCFDLNS